jgi:hypothetical protein
MNQQIQELREENENVWSVLIDLREAVEVLPFIALIHVLNIY